MMGDISSTFRNGFWPWDTGLVLYEYGSNDMYMEDDYTWKLIFYDCKNWIYVLVDRNSSVIGDVLDIRSLDNCSAKLEIIMSGASYTYAYYGQDIFFKKNGIIEILTPEDTVVVAKTHTTT